MRIMLPANNKGKPDYEYMEQYTKKYYVYKVKKIFGICKKLMPREKIEINDIYIIAIIDWWKMHY